MRRGEGCIDQGDGGGGGGGSRRRRRRRRPFIMLTMSLNVSNTYEGSVVEEDGEPLTRRGSNLRGGVGCQREGRGSATCAGNGLCEVAEEEEEEEDLRTTVRISV